MTDDDQTPAQANEAGSYDAKEVGKKALHAGPRRYGWRPSQPDQRDFYLKFTPGAYDHLAQIDHIDLSDKMPPCYDQGDLGSCTANAVGGVLQFLEIKQGVTEQTTPSRLFEYWNSRYLDPHSSVYEDTGSTISMAIKAVKTYGFADENLWPYVTKKFAVQPPASVYTSAVKGRITDYARVNQTVNDMKVALVAGNPIAFGFTVYTSFETASVAKTGIVPMPSKRERAAGGHAVVIVGFDDTTQRFKVRNSWGSDWGQNGYFTIPYAYLINRHLAGDFWVINAIPQS